MSFYSELKRRNVFRVAAAYVVTAWLAIQVGQTILPLFGFDDSLVRLIVIVLAVGFVPVLVLSWLYELTDEGLRKEKDVAERQSFVHSTGRKLDFAIIGLLILALGYFGYDKVILEPDRIASAMRYAVSGLEEVRFLAGENNYADAYARAKELDSDLTDESLREDIWEAVSEKTEFSSEPSGASVWIRPYDSSEKDWEYLGRTPLEGARVPHGIRRLRMELEGYQTLYVAEEHGGMYQFDPANSLPEAMLRVPGGKLDLIVPGIEYLVIDVPGFLIDATEVTNSKFKEFVDAGGYENPEHWKIDFVRNGDALSFEDAMQLFTDQTGRPGPSTWALGAYSDEMADHPVAGVSWFEAAAYAQFAGKELPTLPHWYMAGPGREDDRYEIVPHSNFHSDGTVPVGSLDAISSSGAHDMAGNVREWVWNEVDDDRAILGGGWSDLVHFYSDANAHSPFDRSKINGFRLMTTPGDASPAELRAPLNKPSRDYTTEIPVSDEIFENYRRQYAYDKSPLNAKVLSTDATGHWAREKIELDAAYGNERLTVFMYLPNDIEPPFPPIVYYPGAGAVYLSDAIPPDKLRFTFLIKSGYAILYPIYNGTWARKTGLKTDVQNATSFYRDHVIQWSKDLGRAVDYLETRSDVDINQLGYYGYSWGVSIAPVMIAMEPRIKAAVLNSGGLFLEPSTSDVDPFNFLPRVRVPTRMVNFPSDYYFPYDSSQKPFFDYLGTGQKDHILVGEGGHGVPLNDLARATLDWFELHLHPLP